VDEDVVHVNGDVAFIDQLSKDEIHHRLERGGRVRESEKHDHGFEEPTIGLEGRFPLVTISNAYIIISPSDVQLREECRSATVHSRESIHELSYQW
jgi:hypothetical protein